MMLSGTKTRSLSVYCLMHILVRRLCLLLVIALIACSSVWAANDPQPPQFRLPAFAAPTRYRANLTVAPNKDTLTGQIEIDFRFLQASPVLWLNADKITIQDATLTVGGQNVPLKILPQPKDLVGFAFDRPIGPGAATTRIKYQGEISRKDMQGIYQVKDGDRWYIYSMFENIAARRAYPCFDEPGFKVPWQLTLNVPKDLSAFSNTPVLSETPAADGMKTVKFAETKPLPSYLVAIAVGAMDLVDAGHAGANNKAIRIIVPKGRSAEAAYVASTTPAIVNLLEKYFGIPYPYEKLDEVAVPFAGFAEEHPGLVTYGAGFFLFKPGQDTPAAKQLITSVMAHELAHQWFGDLVTTAWWDDIWLNEGFASWMANKIVNQYRPGWNMDIDELNRYQGAMQTDELVSSRKVRQAILSDDDIANAFDNITYDKGSALMNMFELYIGPEKFQDGVQRYLRKYSFGSATSTQFLDSIAGGDSSVLQAFSTFLDQAGVPLVTTQLKCAAGGAQLQLSQERFLPRGSQGSSAQLWGIPFCAKYPAGASTARECTLMTGKTATMSLAKVQGCPAWVYGNAGESGYYRVRYEHGMLDKVLRDDTALSLPERVGLVGNIASLTKAYMPLGEAMGLVPKFAHDRQREVVTKTLDIVGGNFEDQLVPQELKPNYQRYISDNYKSRAEDLGWKDKPGETDNDRLLRPPVVDAVTHLAEDPEFVAEAKKLALAWLDDRNAVDRDMLPVVLTNAARPTEIERSSIDCTSRPARKPTRTCSAP